MIVNDAKRTSPQDPGLQLERTTLAWLRTTLAFVVGVLLVIRLLVQQKPAVAAVCSVFLLPVAVAVTWLSWLRHRQDERNLREHPPSRDGLLPAAVTALAMFVGGAGIVYILST